MHRRPTKTRALVNVLTALLVIVTVFSSQAHAETKTFAPDDQRVLTNPERGLYLQFTSQAESDPLDLQAVKALRDQNISLTLRLYYLKTFRDRPLSDKQLNMIRDDFAILREAGVKCVLRFAYSQGIGEPDAPIDLVLKHLDQLKPILTDNADVIATVQTGFVGAWGEWHASTNDLAEPVNAKKIVHKWLESIPESRTIQLRTPRQKWMVLDRKTPIKQTEAHTSAPVARIGHHNDCFISSETDVGTYEDIAFEKNYLAKETAYLPMGGETCALTKFAQSDNARKEMQNLHFSYLNLGYHPEVLDLWRTEGFLPEVRRRLGYRLSLESIDYQPANTIGKDWPVTITLTNTGFAAPYNPRNARLILAATDGQAEHMIEFDSDPRTWLPKNSIKIGHNAPLPASVTPGKYRLLFALPDPEPRLQDRPEFAIQLANPGLWDNNTGRHDLGITITVE